MKEEQSFSPDLNLEHAFSSLSSPELGMDSLSGKSVYYFDSDKELMRPDRAGVIPIDFITKWDSDAIIILGKNTAKQKLRGECSMLAVMSGNLDFGMNATYRFGFVTEAGGKQVRKIFYPRSNDVVSSHINPIFRAMDTFLNAAQHYARVLPPSDSATGHRLVSRELPDLFRRSPAKSKDTITYH